MDQPSIAILGAGIGGLTLANALKRRGLAATLYERAPGLAEVGAGIWVPPNAMQVLERLGLDQIVASRSQPLRAIELSDRTGKVFHTLDLGQAQRTFGHTTQSIHRAVLQQTLADAWAPHTVVFGKDAVTVAQDNGNMSVTFADGTTAFADVVVGADGVRSRVREYVFPGVALRDSGQTCFRGIADIRLPDQDHNICREVWGDRHRLGYSAISASQVYWFAPISKPFDTGNDVAGALRALYSDFPMICVDILAATPADRIIQTDLMDTEPLDRWYNHGAVLLGDAAHATTPNVGQGAAQAMESAYVLARALATHDSLGQAFAHYESVRMEKAHHVTNTSWMLGRAAHMEDGPMRMMRDFAMRNTPRGYNDKMVNRLYALDY